jgi:hypothetical protein
MEGRGDRERDVDLMKIPVFGRIWVGYIWQKLLSNDNFMFCFCFSAVVLVFELTALS